MIRSEASPKFFLLSLILFLSSISVAEAYTWQAQSNFHWESPSAMEECLKFVKKKSELSPGFLNYNIRLRHWDPSPSHINCEYDIKRLSDNRLFSGDVTLARRGSSCQFPGWISDDRSGECFDANDAPPACELTGGTNPIHIKTGRKFQTEMDYLFGKHASLTLSRFYHGGPYQARWLFNYSQHLTVENHTSYLLIKAIRETGEIERYIGTSQDGFSSQKINAPQLVSLFDESRNIVGWKMLFNSGLIEHYDENGRLVRIIEGGETLEVVHAANSYTVNSRSAFITFVNDNEKIKRATLSSGGEFIYSYNELGMLTKALFRPDASSVSEEVKIYHYDNVDYPHLLTGISDGEERGYVSWGYDEAGRGIYSEHGGSRVSIEYQTDGSTIVTGPLGKKTIYKFVEINGTGLVSTLEGVATAHCAGAYKTYTYTREGWIESKTDWKGNTTTYSYNTFGQEISRTEASGTPEARTIITEWHPDFFAKARVVEGGRETLYTYDDHGRLLNTTINPVSVQ